MMLAPRPADYDAAQHRANCRAHAKHRAWQRYGLALGERELREMEALIWQGKAKWIADGRKSLCQIYELRLRKRRLLAIFSIQLEIIVTFLPPKRGAWIK